MWSDHRLHAMACLSNYNQCILSRKSAMHISEIAFEMLQLSLWVFNDVPLPLKSTRATAMINMKCVQIMQTWVQIQHLLLH